MIKQLNLDNLWKIFLETQVHQVRPELKKKLDAKTKGMVGPPTVSAKQRRAING